MKKLKYRNIIFVDPVLLCVDDESRYGDIDIDEIKIEGIKRLSGDRSGGN